MAKAAQAIDASGAGAAWRRFSATLLAGALALGLGLAALILWADPFGLRARAGGPAPVLIDSNQRYVYPQLVRSGRFNAAVIGTSSSRLLDPARLSASFGARFANLAMNAATPYEQTRMARLVRANWAAPRAIIWGIDATWCEADADQPAKRLTPRPFPEAFYEDAPPGWRAMAGQMNLATLEIAARRVALALGQGAPRMRGDGYDEFTPPDATFDAARARFHLYLAHGGAVPPALPPAPDMAATAEGFAFPALAWLEAELAALPASTRKLILMPPLHWASLPAEGSGDVARNAACKRALVTLAERVDASLLDYRLLSPLTRDDSRFWDPLHYRIDVARRIEDDLARADREGSLGQGRGQGAAQEGDVVLRHTQRR